MASSRGLYYDPVLGDFWLHHDGETRHVVRVRWKHSKSSSSEEPQHYDVEWIDGRGDRRLGNERGWRLWIFPRGVSGGPSMAQREGFVSPTEAEVQ